MARQMTTRDRGMATRLLLGRWCQATHWDPQRVEQVARSRFLFAMILLQVEKIWYVCVPGLDVHRKRAFALAFANVAKLALALTTSPCKT